MTSRYVVQPQEDLEQILYRRGRADLYQRVLEHEANHILFATRRPEVLCEGDELEIPDDSADLKKQCATGKSHRFVVRRLQRRVALELRDGSNRPRQGRWRLEFDGQGVEGELVNGRLEAFIGMETTTATLILEKGRAMILHIGRLEPVASLRGLQARLLALGFLKGAVNGEFDKRTQDAISAFQLRYGLRVTGQGDPPTRHRLAEVYGCGSPK